MGSLDGRVAIVTGGTRGIGLAYVRGLAAEGAAVMVADIAEGGDVVRQVTDGGGRADWVRADVTDQVSTEAMARATAGRFDELDVDEWDRSFAINVRGPWLCARAVYPYMKARGYGKIINVSSTTVWDGTPNFLHYVSTKAAMIGFTRSLAREVGEDN